MRTAIAAGLVSAAVTAAILSPAVGAHDGSDYFWSSTEATLALGESDWAADRNVRSASCRGTGAFRRDVIEQPTFKHFRCALRNASFRIVAEVTLHTTAPEQFELTNLTNRLKACRPR